MKPFKKVNEDRVLKTKIVDKNTVHRSSLLVPEIDNTSVEISMLNHFLIKRNIKNVTCKITAIDTDGNIVDNKSFELCDPRVYVFKLSELFKNGNTYNVEFFSSHDLFVPFTAVIINHIGKNFISQVHAYNRILNDIFEDSVVNKIKVDECCIDLNNNEETFFVFSTGNNKVKDEVKLKAFTKDKIISDSHKFYFNRFESRKFDVSDILNGSENNNLDGHLIIKQPYQQLFYGRLLVGQRYKDGAFSANHSYYDSSDTEEYWEDIDVSYRIYPFLIDFENRVNIYPNFSKSQLDFSIDLFNGKGSIIKSYSLGSLLSPSKSFIKHLIDTDGINKNEVVSFGLKAISNNKKMPTRVTHQLVYGRGKIKCSINTSLTNSKIFRNPKYGTFAWGELIGGKDYSSILSIVAGSLPEDCSLDYLVNLEIYSRNGLVFEQDITIVGGACKNVSIDEIIDLSSQDNEHDYFWYTIKSKSQGLTAYSVSWNLDSNHCSGEHSF